MTYLVGGWAGTGLRGRSVTCSESESAIFDPPPGQTCLQYLTDFLNAGAPGQLYNPSATSACQYCPISSAEQFLAATSVYPSQRWRNFGIVWAFIVFNVSDTSQLPTYLNSPCSAFLRFLNADSWPDLCLYRPLLRFPHTSVEHCRPRQGPRTYCGPHPHPGCEKAVRKTLRAYTTWKRST